MSRIQHLNPPSTPAPSDTLTIEMASALNSCGANLDDERKVISALTARRFRSGDIVALVDDVIALARRQRSAGPTVAVVALLVLVMAAPAFAAGGCSDNTTAFWVGHGSIALVLAAIALPLVRRRIR